MGSLMEESRAFYIERQREEKLILGIFGG